MPNDAEAVLLNFYSSKILEIFDSREEFTRGDLQGAIEAIVLALLRGDHHPIIKQANE